MVPVIAATERLGGRKNLQEPEAEAISTFSSRWRHLKKKKYLQSRVLYIQKCWWLKAQRQRRLGAM